MNSDLPPHLRRVLKFYVLGWTHAAIARELLLSPLSVETYVKRLKEYFEGEPEFAFARDNISSERALAVAGVRYLDQEQALNPHPFDRGTRLLLIGSSQMAQYQWEDAQSSFRQVEIQLGEASSQAARAAVGAAFTLILLGDCRRAETEADRIEAKFVSMDLETQAALCVLRGWLAYYYYGNLLQAETWFRRALQIAEQTGSERIAENAQHFLGRVYSDLGQVLSQRDQYGGYEGYGSTLSMGSKERARDSFIKAEAEFDAAYQLHERHGLEVHMAVDLLRKALLLRQMSRAHDAQLLRRRVRGMLGRDWAVAHLVLDEAKVALQDSDFQTAKRKAQYVVDSWVQVKYAKGIADPFKLLGHVERSQGRLPQALMFYTAALCIYPFDSALGNRQTWSDITEVAGQIGEKTYQRCIHRIEGMAHAYQGPFSYMSSLAVDRSVDVPRIIGKLHGIV